MYYLDGTYVHVRTLENLNIDEYELIDMPMEQPDKLPHELTGLRMALPLQIHYIRLSRHPVTGIQVYCIQELTLSKGPFSLAPCMPPQLSNTHLQCQYHSLMVV